MGYREILTNPRQYWSQRAELNRRPTDYELVRRKAKMSALGREQTYVDCHENYKTCQNYLPFEPVRNFFKLGLPAILTSWATLQQNTPPPVKTHNVPFLTKHSPYGLEGIQPNS